MKTCTQCNGTGWVLGGDDPTLPTQVECPVCHGTGKVSDLSPDLPDEGEAG